MLPDCSQLSLRLFCKSVTGGFCNPGFALVGKFRYFTGYGQGRPETKAAVGQTYRLLLCLTGS